MKGHTPGPWEIDWVPYGDPDVGVEGYEPSGDLLASDGKVVRCTEANERLKAAAPEMLEALKAALTFYDRAELPHMPGEAVVLDNMSAAIAKAEGQQ